MADPLSVAGLAAGLVSLSLEVTSGITQYLDALKSRTEELDSARKHNEYLRVSIIAIQASVARAQPHHQAASQVVIDAIKQCECAIKSLEDLVAELTGCDSSTWQRVRLKGKKLRYAFDRPKVHQLTSRLADANATIGTALQILAM
ncbi:hypothetical protein PG999_012342 [Apiospora kogelbergensis]|uniref:Fungal N-terminal domain-containing protein n=1 Tax=Apiospora kogelbergensis TaxID=1337665 RepID=A0AAW0QU58_9PEZI